MRRPRIGSIRTRRTVWTHVRVPRTKDLRARADKKTDASTGTENLVESGNYKPDPSRIATAMLQRRGVRELLIGAYAGPAGRSQPSPDSSPPGSLISTPAPAATLADRCQRRFRGFARPRAEASREALAAAAPPAARSPRRPARPARAGRARRPRRPRRRPRRAAARPASIRSATPLRCGEVAGVAAEAVAEVDHRRRRRPRPGPGRRAAAASARAGGGAAARRSPARPRRRARGARAAAARRRRRRARRSGPARRRAGRRRGRPAARARPRGRPRSPPGSAPAPG